MWGHSVAELCQDVIALHAELEPLAKIGGPLDKYYIPTRYPNGLPGGIPSDAFTAADAEMAISDHPALAQFALTCYDRA